MPRTCRVRAEAFDDPASPGPARTGRRPSGPTPGRSGSACRSALTRLSANATVASDRRDRDGHRDEGAAHRDRSRAAAEDREPHALNGRRRQTRPPPRRRPARSASGCCARRRSGERRRRATRSASSGSRSPRRRRRGRRGRRGTQGPARPPWRRRSGTAPTVPRRRQRRRRRRPPHHRGAARARTPRGRLAAAPMARSASTSSGVSRLALDTACPTTRRATSPMAAAATASATASGRMASFTCRAADA